MINIFKPPLIYLTVAISLIVLVLGTVIFTNLNKAQKIPVQSPSPAPSIQRGIPQVIKPPSTDELPYKPTDQGGGLDLNAPVVQESKAGVQKLNTYLPYQTELDLSTGIKASVVIPGQQFQTDNWTLTVQIFGIDYQVSEGDKDYEVMRKSFLEASSSVFEWIKDKGVDPEKLIIIWGDRAFIQESAEKWLNSQ